MTVCLKRLYSQRLILLLREREREREREGEGGREGGRERGRETDLSLHPKKICSVFSRDQKHVSKIPYSSWLKNLRNVLLKLFTIPTEIH